jgi:hypothetical protein
MDPTLIVAIIGFAGLFLERLFSWARHIKKSKCCNAEIEMDSDSKEKS